MRKDKNRSSYFLLPMVVVLGGCAGLPGTYNFGPWVEYEAITLSEDGSFEYTWWSDDGGTQCGAFGKWVELDDRPKRVQTTVEKQVAGAYDEGCVHLAAVNVWDVSFGDLVRNGNQRFSRVKRDRN